MASIKPGKSGYRAQVYVRGKRDSATFDTEKQAAEWAKKREAELLEVSITPAKAYTFGELLGRYAAEVSPTKRGERWERIRIEAIKRDKVASVRLSNLTPADISAWRDRRLKSVKSSSVIREMTLIKHCLEVARRDWHLIEVNPAKDVRRPPAQPHRERRISDKEVEAICLALGYQEGPPVTVQQRVALAFLFALETAMRSGEICALKGSDISGKVARLRQTKNGTARSVPLSPRALEIIKLLDKEKLFDLSDKSRDTTFRLAVKRAGIDGLTFHDSRREATHRLSKKLSVMDLARVTGHKDLKMLMVYYTPSAEELAGKLG